MMRWIMAVIVCLALQGCGASVLDADANGIWLQEPMFHLGNPDAKAEEHCRQFGKRAVYQSTIEARGKTQYYLPIRAYNCQ